MCGIAGIFSKEKVELSKVKAMTDRISHRGPDGEGHWTNKEGNLILGHRRLSIIDLSDAGKQPMHYAERFTITFNGEIYNYVELKEDLVKEGFKFRSDSDTEVLLALYQKYGKDCLKFLDGMFAFAIYDSEKRELFCARDRFGEKPFFYSYVPGEHFIFGSEIKQIFEAGINREFNPTLLYNYLEKPFVLTNPNDEHETFYSSIKKLPKASFAIINSEVVLKEEKYWSINLSKKIKISYDDAIREFKNLFFGSIDRRMRSDVPVGSSLSGGLDSSSIVCSIHDLYKNKGLKQRTFSARFKNFHRDEGIYIEYVLNGKNIESFNTWPDEEGFINSINKLMYHQDEPFPTASIYAQYCVMEEAKKQNVVVLLDGQGADEILAGYEYYLTQYLQELRTNDPELYYKELDAMKQVHPHMNFNDELSYELKSEQRMTNSSIKDKFKDAVRPLYKKINPAKYKRLEQKLPLGDNYDNAFFDRIKETKQYDFNIRKNSLNEYLKFSVETNNLEDLLRFSDRNSMAHSREVRLPFLSTDLVEFLFTLPASFKIRNGWTKSILRDAMHDIIPPEIEKRVDKIGYEPPQKKWMENPLLKQQIRASYEKLKDERIISEKAVTEGKKDWQVMNIANLMQAN